MDEAQRSAIRALETMCVVEPGEKLGRDEQRQRHRQALPTPEVPRQQARQVAPPHVLHRDEDLLVELTEVEDLDHVEVLNGRRELGFLDEHARKDGLGRIAGMNPLERDQLFEAVAALELGEIDLRHAPVPDPFDEEIGPETLETLSFRTWHGPKSIARNLAAGGKLQDPTGAGILGGWTGLVVSRSGENDHVLRALTNDGSFRVITARTTQTVQAAIRAQDVSGPSAEHFANLLTGAVIIRETMAPNMRVQVALRGAEQRGSLLADAHPGGLTRGLVNLGAEAAHEVQAGPDAMIQVSRTFPSGALHQGVVRIPRDGGLSAGFMSYMASSEQVVSMIAVGCKMKATGEVEAAGGYIVQLLPEVGEEPLRNMIPRLEKFKDIANLLSEIDAAPDKLLEELLHGSEYTKLDNTPVFFGCLCSPVRVVMSLATLGRDDIDELVKNRRSVDVTCDYCGTEYAVGPEQLKPLLASS